MDPILFLRGWVRLRLTSADCAGRLREISRENRLEQISFEEGFAVSFVMLRSRMKDLPIREGERLELLEQGGVPAMLARFWRWRRLSALILVLLALSVFLPSRVWFLEVEGNAEIPRRLILEYASACGVSFGASRREIRSEQVKNHLLWAIPELRWAGVNTQGCRAVITVRERDGQEQEPEQLPGDLIAVRDALVTQVTIQTGTARIAPGQAVRAGQMLISGSEDLGITVRVDRAEGEVYGLTKRSVTAALPENTLLRREKGRQIRRLSILIGKKRVNFSDDSGILYGTCVKMRTVKNLKLPGGFELPVALVMETYDLCDTQQVQRPDARNLLLEAARADAQSNMIAGTILEEKTSLDGQTLTAQFSCREMIARFRPGIGTEGDTNDRENRERGAG